MRVRHADWQPRVLVACRRNRLIAAAVLNHDDILEVKCLALPANPTSARKINVRRSLVQLADDYDVSVISIEDDARLGSLLSCAGRPIELASTELASAVLLHKEAACLDELFGHVLQLHPKLGRFVTILPGTGQVARSERWRTIVLLTVALGLSVIYR